MKSIEKEKLEQAHGKIAGWLVSKGCNPIVAKVVIGVLIAGLVAGLGITVTGCNGGSLTVEQGNARAEVVFPVCPSS